MAEWNKEQNSSGQRNAMQDPAREPHMDQKAGKEQAEYSPPMQSDFLRETIKQKPINKKKLLRRTALTVVMAVVFGLVACFTFLVLEPVISNRLYPEEEAEEVRFPEETVAEEMKPEDMLVEEEVEPPPEAVPVELEDEQIEELLSQVRFGLEDYQMLYEELAALAKKTGRAVVTVTSVVSDVDWFNDIYENEVSASGIIVANNGKAVLILVSAGALSDADSIIVTFCDQARADAQLVQKDTTTGLAVLSVPLMSIGEETMDVIDIAKLGSSNNANLPGTPVMALGSPMGTSGTVCYGIVTSAGGTIDQPDSAYKSIVTDIYGSRNATGILADLNGTVLGIIDNVNISNDMENLLIHGADVPAAAVEKAEMPAGTYVKEIEMDSPAMHAGIQSGDVITKANETAIESYNDLLNVLYDAKPEDVLNVLLVRQGQEVNVQVTLGRR